MQEKPIEAIILAGGLGTRLRAAVPDLPKCMAPVKGRPFLDYVIDYFLQQGIGRFIFAVGYKQESIVQHLNDQYPTLSYAVSIESNPLGTGGGIRQACRYGSNDNILVANGDTFYQLNIASLLSSHRRFQADCTIGLKPMHCFDRYGAVALHADQSIKDFQEKRYYESGLINGGVYALNRNQFLKEALPAVFSFEKDYLEQFTGKKRFYGYQDDGYFIDIGIPADYERAQTELPSL